MSENNRLLVVFSKSAASLILFVNHRNVARYKIAPTTLPLTARYFNFLAQLLAVLIFRDLPLRCRPVYCFYAILHWRAYLFA